MYSCNSNVTITVAHVTRLSLSLSHVRWLEDTIRGTSYYMLYIPSILDIKYDTSRQWITNPR